MATSVEAIKAHLSQDDGSIETRRFPLSEELLSSSSLFQAVFEKIGYIFATLKTKEFQLMWKDSDDDFVLMTSNEEIRDALAASGNSAFQVYIKVIGDKKENMTPPKPSKFCNGAKAKASKENSDQNNSQSQKETENESQNFWPPFGFPPSMMGIPPPPPPPPPFGFGAPWPGMEGFHGGHHHGYHPFGPGMGGYPKGRMGHGPFGMHFGQGRGHPFSPHHHHHHHGKHHHGHHFGKNGAESKNEGCMQKGDWKADLRNGVPMLQRQWTKKFIQRWRQENLANATTTSSDNCSDEEATFEKAGIPQAYKKWLVMMLPKWHKKWSADAADFKATTDSDNEFDKKECKMTKTSVPKEYRKWTKWYLQRHFGRKEAPKFKDCQVKKDGHCHKMMHNNGRKFKRQILATLVPANHRVWAKAYIIEWRKRNNLESVVPGATTTSESEDGVDEHVDDDMTEVPEAYGKWLDVFLPKWHMWRGFLERSDAMNLNKGNPTMGEFKTTVPMDFRQWVKHYLCRQYGRNKHQMKCGAETGVDDPIAKRHKMWLQIFKKQWLKQMAPSTDDESGEEFTVLTSNGDGNDYGAVPEKSFKKLRLSDDEEEMPQKTVRFDPSTSNQVDYDTFQKAAMDLCDDPENMEVKQGRRKFPINHGFRKWVWQELDAWDGELDDPVDTQTSSTSGEDMDDLPLSVQQWMLKVMWKLQKKKMKQQMKASIQEMKATRQKAKAEFKAARRAGKFDD